jgi:hypothetical protein
LHPALQQDRAHEFSQQLKLALENQARLAIEVAANGPRLREERSELERQADNLVKAIAEHGISPFLSAKLATAESRLAEISHQLAAKPAAKTPVFSEEYIREFLGQACQQFSEILTSDPERGKLEIQKRITKLVLTPKETPEGRRLDVSGDVALFVGDAVMLNSSLEGIAHHYILPQLTISVVLDTSAPLAA